MKSYLKLLSLPLLALIFVSVTSFAAPQPASRCMNVYSAGTAALGLFEIADGVVVFGALPTPSKLGDLDVSVTSYITSPFLPQGSNAQGALLVTLRHIYTSLDPAREGTFITEDRAVCAPAGKDPTTCIVNDVLTIVSGTGIFEDAGGHLMNHGVIDLANKTVSFNVRGRVCGNGL